LTLLYVLNRVIFVSLTNFNGMLNSFIILVICIRSMLSDVCLNSIYYNWCKLILYSCVFSNICLSVNNRLPRFLALAWHTRWRLHPKVQVAPVIVRVQHLAATIPWCAKLGTLPLLSILIFCLQF
jgi:hypothetical protein